MHAIKKAARKEAWYHNNTDENRTYNIWARWKPQPLTRRDLETGRSGGLLHTNSENAVSPVEDARKKSSQQDREGFEGPQKSGTYPLGPVGNLPRHGEDVISSSEVSKDSTEEKKDSTDVTASKPPTTLVDSSVGSQDNGASKPRQRLRAFLHIDGKDTQDTDATRTDSEDSSKQKRKGPDTSHLTIMSQIKTVAGSWINLMIVFVPAGIALHYAGINKIVVFVINFLAIVPLAAMLSFATEELALYVGETIGGLLNATFGNAVELIVGVIALNQGQILIVQTSLIGSMLSNLLLVMGMCFFFGGLRRTEQFFNVTVAQTAASLLALAIGSLIIPTAFKIFEPSPQGVAPLSRGTSILLLFTYACYLLFQLRTHVDMYNEPSQKSPKKPSRHQKRESGEMKRGLATMGADAGAAMAGGQFNVENLVHVDDDDDDPEAPQLTRIGALVTLAVSTVLIALCAEFMVSSIDAVAQSVSPEFIGLILLPIVGNAAEHATAVTVAIKDKMDLAIGVAVGSSLQVALLVLPLMVLLSWFGVGQSSGPSMTLDFDGFQVCVLFIAIIVVNYLIQDGKSHWLEGVLLQITYIIIAVAAFFYPATDVA